jgi:DamX protein
MQNEVIEDGKDVQDYPIATWFTKVFLQSELVIRILILIAGVIAALLLSSYIWQNRFLPSSAEEEEITEGSSNSIVEISQPLPSLVPSISALEFVLESKIPDISQEFVNQPSQIPEWREASIKQPIQPSPKQIITIAMNKKNNTVLVIQDKVVVTPITNPVATKAISNKIAQVKEAGKLTIQLLASRKQEDIKRFMKTHNLNKLGKIRLTRRDNLDWYVLTIGEYGQLEQAQIEIKKLAPALLQLKPWIRSVTQLKTLEKLD